MRYSSFEAWSIKQLLGLPEQAAIKGLKVALPFRMYARINVQSISFQINDGRVQSERKRKIMYLR
jgi:hypothetical protein